MANPYYIAPGRNPGIAAADVLLKMRGLKQRGEIAKGQLDVAKTRNKLLARRSEVEYGRPGGEPGISEGLTTQQTTGLAERRVAALEKSVSQKEPIQSQDFNRSTYAPIKALTAQQGTDKAFAPIFDAMDQIADNPDFDKGTTYQHFKKNWPAYQKSLLESFEKEHTKAIKDNDPIKAKNLLEAMQAIEADKNGAIVDKAMPATAAAIQGEQASTKTLKTWITPDGKITNLPNNVQPPEGSVPYSSGMDVSVGPEGGVTLRTGVPRGGAGTERKTAGRLEQKIENASEHLARIGEIKNSYKSEYLQLRPRLEAALTAVRSKLGGKTSESDRKSLKKMTTFLRRTISNLNKHIKEVTGAQMSEKEAGRISLEEPKAGQSWWDFLWSGDSPIEFESKIEDIEATLRASIARFQWYKSKGLDNQTIVDMIQSDAAKDLELIKERLK